MDSEARTSYRGTMDDTDQAPVPPVAPEEPPVARHLARSRTNRLVGGVCGGVADRFEVDANLVRVGFIVLAFLWGIGIVAYLAMWILVPRALGEGEATATPVRTLTRSSVIGLAAVVILVLAVASMRHGVGAPGSALALLWIVLLAGLAVLALRSPTGRSLRRLLRRLVLLVASLLTLLVAAVSVFLVTSGVALHGGTGSRLWQPTTLSQTRHDYALSVGRSVIDLSSVRFPATGYSISASVGVGMLEVVVPDSAVVDLRTHVGIGGTIFPAPGRFSPERFVEVPPTVNARTAARLNLDVQVGIGKLIVERASTFARY